MSEAFEKQDTIGYNEQIDKIKQLDKEQLIKLENTFEENKKIMPPSST